MTKVYAFDPGKTTGIAVGDTEGKLYDTLQWTAEPFYNFLDTISEPSIFVVENFLIRPNKANSFIWSDMEVIQHIGALKYKAFSTGSDFVIQEPSIKSIGYKWAGLQAPKNHAMSHSTDAYAHLVYYWVKKLGLEPPVAKRLRDAEKEKE